jgi:5-methylcytosine-specific restriction endonuclease McrA
MKTDFKPEPRIKDRKARARKLHRDPMCRLGCGNRATQAHHIIYQSGLGDDVEDNLLPLCTDCHVLLHSQGPINMRITKEEREYVRRKLGGRTQGDSYLERRYNA